MTSYTSLSLSMASGRFPSWGAFYELTAADRRERGVLLGSGFVGGEGLLGVGIALVAVAKSRRPDGIGTEWLGSEITALLAGAAAFAVFIAWFFRMVRGRADS